MALLLGLGAWTWDDADELLELARAALAPRAVRHAAVRTLARWSRGERLARVRRHADRAFRDPLDEPLHNDLAIITTRRGDRP